MAGAFAIVCMGRTGSTLLVELLNSHPDIECRGELLGLHSGYVEHPGISRRTFLEQHAYSTELPIKGFKMPLDWIFNHPGVFDDFRELGYRIIRLNRRNALAQLVSIKLAQLNTDWGSKRQYTQQKTRIEPMELYTFIGAQSSYNAVLDRFSEPFKITQVNYEDIMTPDCQERLLSFLGARPHSLATATVKQRSGTLAESIENFAELSAAVSKTPYAALLNGI